MLAREHPDAVRASKGGTARAAAMDAEYEVQREAILAMLERERRSLTASLFGLAVLLCAIALMGMPHLHVIAICLRACSFLFTRWAATDLERVYRERGDTVWPRRILFIAMCLTGATLGLMALPPPETALVASGLMIYAAVLMILTLIAVTLAALPGPRDGMLASFLLTLAVLAFFYPDGQNPTILAIGAMAVIGIRVYSANTGHHIIASAEILVENRELSDELSEALAHAEFLSWRDPLTGLFNRRKLFEEREHDPQNGSARHVLAIDLDHFKGINDRHGHAAGDRVLVASADVIRARLRAFGADHLPAFRHGGEEFIVILDGCDCAEARRFAEALREDIASIDVGIAGAGRETVTASIGLARWHPDETLDDVLQRSDLACYQAKGEGRNRVSAVA